jgi:enamine deaminase RidA (YjgF/YER057c/UK114 family)
MECAMIEERLRELGLELPAPPPPVASYVPAVEAPPFLYISGQLPFQAGKLLHTGKVPEPVTIEAAQQAARQCVLNALAVAKDCLTRLERISRVVRLTGYVACPADFTQQPLVINGASDLLVAIFGDVGKHARVAIGVCSLPLDAPVEVDLILMIEAV